MVPALLLVWLLALPVTYSASFPDSADVALINVGIRLTFCEQYDSAQALFGALSDKYPRNPAGPFFVAAVLQAQMMDHEDFLHEDEFRALLDRAYDRADAWRHREPKSAWAYYFLGMANAYQALFEQRKGRKWPVVQKGIRAGNLLKRAVELDSNLQDAYVGIGSYRYWGAARGGLLSWLPLLGVSREQGLADLMRAADRSLFSRLYAQNALIWVHIDGHHYEAAESLAQALHRSLPESKAFLWALAAARFERHDYASALETYDTLFEHLQSAPYHSLYNLFEVDYYRVRCYHALGRTEQVLSQIRTCLALPLSPGDQRRLKRKIDELRKLSRELSAAHAD